MFYIRDVPQEVRVDKFMSSQELHNWMQQPQPLQLIDVRSPSEFAAGHIPQAVNIPLEELASRRNDLGAAPVVLICLGGQRAGIAAERLAAFGLEPAVLTGGTKAWKEAGLPLVQTQRSGWALERQVRLVAGFLALLGAVLALTVNPLWAWLSAAIGAGLTFAGLSGNCPMATVLGKMPWNKRVANVAPACGCDAGEAKK